MRQHIKEMMKDLYYDEKEELFDFLSEELGKKLEPEKAFIKVSEDRTTIKASESFSSNDEDYDKNSLVAGGIIAFLFLFGSLYYFGFFDYVVTSLATFVNSNLFFTLFILGFFVVFPIWVFIHIVSGQFVGGSDKITWLLVVLFLPFIGALLYVFIGRKQRI